MKTQKKDKFWSKEDYGKNFIGFEDDKSIHKKTDRKCSEDIKIENGKIDEFPDSPD